MNSSGSKFAHVILDAILRPEVLFLTFKFSYFNLFLNSTAALNSRATESKEHRAPSRSNVRDPASRDGGTGSSPAAGASS